jgi:hypothetical protein
MLHAASFPSCMNMYRAGNGTGSPTESMSSSFLVATEDTHRILSWASSMQFAFPPSTWELVLMLRPKFAYVSETVFCIRIPIKKLYIFHVSHSACLVPLHFIPNATHRAQIGISPACTLLHVLVATLFMIYLTWLSVSQWSYPCSRPCKPIGLWDVEDPTLSRHSAHRWQWCCQLYAPTMLYSPRNITFLLLILISVGGWVYSRA